VLIGALPTACMQFIKEARQGQELLECQNELIVLPAFSSAVDLGGISVCITLSSLFLLNTRASHRSVLDDIEHLFELHYETPIFVF
jgi:hypothetical protein